MAIETRYPPGGLRDLNADILWQSGIHPSKTGLSGSRVVCCIIDYGFDLLHPALREADGSTRFAALIDQNGAIHDRAAINALIKLSEEAGARGPADALYDPHANYFGRDGVTVGAHGTWVASIAAGTSSPGFTGVAPQATLIGVHLDLADDAWRAADLAEFSSAAEPNDGRAKRWRSYDQSQTIVEALQSALTAALALDPDGIVLNLSIGAWAGSHHASAAANRAITRVSALNDLPGGPAVFVVAGTGNAGDDRGHFGATIAPGTTRSLTWHFGAGRPTAEKLEIWSDQPISVRFRTATQSNNDQASLVLDGPGLKQLFIDHRLAGVGERVAGPCDELTCAHFLIMPDRLVEGGVAGETIPCVLDITCEGTRAGEVHVWIERDCAGATSHLEPSNRASTLTSLASAPGVLAVAGLGECDTTAPSVMAMSGRGPAPWARCTEATASPFEAAPAIAAPASRIWGARSKTTAFMRGSGTSAAAAVVSGATALAIEAAARRGLRLSRPDLLALLTGRAPSTWSATFGWGPLAFASGIQLHHSTPSRRGGQRPAPRSATHSKPSEVEGYVAP